MQSPPRCIPIVYLYSNQTSHEPLGYLLDMLLTHFFLYVVLLRAYHQNLHMGFCYSIFLYFS